MYVVVIDETEDRFIFLKSIAKQKIYATSQNVYHDKSVVCIGLWEVRIKMIDLKVVVIRKHSYLDILS